MRDVLAVILGGGEGRRLYPLTKFRAKPAVPIGGKFRLIDIPISNCLHWNIRKIFLLTQFNTASLHRHIFDTYKFDSFSEGFLQILAAQQTLIDTDWYQGTADSVRKNLQYIKNQKVDQVVILSGDQLYRINLSDFVKAHRENGADITIAVKPVCRDKAGEFGIVKINDHKKIIQFKEKPKDPAQLDALFTPGEYLGLQEGNLNYIASMGIYIFNHDVLIELLENNTKEDFGREIIPDSIDAKNVYAYVFEGYWEDIGTIRSFFEANLDFANPVPHFNFYDEKFPIYTRKRFLPGSKIENCEIHHGLISDGSIIEGAKITNTVVGLRSVIRANTTLERVVMMGADYYETIQDLKKNDTQHHPHIGIGYNCLIKNAILDKNVRIGNNVKIINQKGLQNLDAENYHIVDGVTVIPKDSVIPEGSVI